MLKKQSANFSGEPFPFTGHNALPQSILELSTPYQFFKYFFTDEIVSKIADETNLYSTQKNPNKPVDCTVYDIHKFIGICILSSLAPPTCVRDLWNDIYGILNLVILVTVSKPTTLKPWHLIPFTLHLCLMVRHLPY